MTPLMLAWCKVLRARTSGTVVEAIFTWWRLGDLLERGLDPTTQQAERERVISALAEARGSPEAPPWRDLPTWPALERSLRYEGAGWRVPLNQAEWDAFDGTERGLRKLLLRSWLDSRPECRTRLIEDREGLGGLLGRLAEAVADLALSGRTPARGRHPSPIETRRLPALFQSAGEPADDLRQEAVSYFLEKLLPGTWNATRGRMSNYLAVAAANHLRRLLRDRKRREIPTSPENIDLDYASKLAEAGLGGQLESTAEVEAADLLDRLRAGLTPRQRQICGLLELDENLTVPNIAEQTGIPLRTVERDLQRIRTRLDSLLRSA
jgi:RNA polymerase sigma factor (sigma-70 family)